MKQIVPYLFFVAFSTASCFQERSNSSLASNAYPIPKYLEKAYEKGFSHKGEDGEFYELYSREVGDLKIAEGKIIACDPFLYDKDLPFEASFPKGSFPVQLAIAKIATDERTAFSRIKFSEEMPVSWTTALVAGQKLEDLKKDEIYGYGVDSGTGALMDASGAKELKRFLTEKDDNYDILINLMNKSYQHTRSWLNWESKKVNVIMFSSGYGDGFYASYIGYDKHGHICRLVTDFGVLE